MIEHEEAFERLSELLEGDLSAAEAEGVQAHVAGCPACASRLEALRTTLAGLQALPTVPAPNDLVRRVRRRVRRRPPPRGAAWMQEMATAAVLAVVIGTGVLVGGRVLAPEVTAYPADGAPASTPAAPPSSAPKTPTALAGAPSPRGAEGGGGSAVRRRSLVLRYAPDALPAVRAFVTAAADAGAVDPAGRPLDADRALPEEGLVLLVRESSLSLASVLLARSGATLEPAPAPRLSGAAAALPSEWTAVRLVAR